MSERSEARLAHESARDVMRELTRVARAAGITQREIGARMHRPQSVVSGLERGIAQHPRLSLIQAYADAIGAVVRMELTVDVSGVHVAYPHEPGRLYDCPGCEARCYCEPGLAACVHCAPE